MEWSSGKGNKNMVERRKRRCQVGSQARLAHSTNRWNRRVLDTIEIIYSPLYYEVLYFGGGNAARIVVDLPYNVSVASNDAGIAGGNRLWDADFDTPSPRSSMSTSRRAVTAG